MHGLDDIALAVMAQDRRLLEEDGGELARDDAPADAQMQRLLGRCAGGCHGGQGQRDAHPEISAHVLAPFIARSSSIGSSSIGSVSWHCQHHAGRAERAPRKTRQSSGSCVLTSYRPLARALREAGRKAWKTCSGIASGSAGRSIRTQRGGQRAMRSAIQILVTVLWVAATTLGAGAALAQEPKHGGILTMYHRDNPASASLH